jgi:hypothetical protein
VAVAPGGNGQGSGFHVFSISSGYPNARQPKCLLVQGLERQLDLDPFLSVFIIIL